MLALLTLLPATTQAQPEETYTIVVLENQTLDQAERLKSLMDDWGYHPVLLIENAGLYEVTYGQFDSKADAEAAMKKLEAEGLVVTRIETSTVTIGIDKDDTEYCIVVFEYRDREPAAELSAELREKGYPDVRLQDDGKFWQVLVGKLDREATSTMLSRLRRDGYQRARISAIASAASQSSTVIRQPGTQTQREVNPDEVQLSPLITQSELWDQLNEEQKRQVINSVSMQKMVRKGDDIAPKIIDIEKRLSNLDDKVRQVIDKITEEEQLEAERQMKVAALFKEAEDLTRAQEYDRAILKYKEVEKIDPNNMLAKRRVIVLQEKAKGYSYEGQSEELEREYAQLASDAKRLENSTNIQDLRDARTYWNQIKRLDPEKYGPTAEEHITQISGLIQRAEEAARNDKKEEDKRMQLIIFSLVGALALSLLISLYVLWRNKRQNRIMMEKIQEITQVRPMRELTANSTQGLLDGETGSDSDIFSPQTPTAMPGDPLGGVEETAKDDETPEAPESPATDDDPFADMNTADEPQAESNEPETVASEDITGFDDLFADDDNADQDEAPATEKAPEETVEAEEQGPISFGDGDGDDPFSDLFGEDDASGETPKDESPAEEAPQPEESMGPISLDVFGEDEDNEASADDNTEDLLSAFDHSQEDAPAESGSVEERFADSPFASLLDEEDSDDGTGTVVTPADDDTELPSISLDGPEDTIDPQHSATESALDFPAISLDEETRMEAGASDEPGGISLDFESDTIGEKPEGWQGNYDFATLAVQADTPPKGSQQYLLWTKEKGDGKAFYTCAFPEITGTVGIEFDLRCNDKNKFLLGFYVEKDGDFQSSIHTKILRSEVQTTPMIHMQGESAPYLLGSWAHIKYVVDLNAGKLNGYIDGTHVVQDMTLENNPGSLNTISIRDNINTTGVLLLNNIMVYEA